MTERVALLYGGRSKERAVSLKTGRAIGEALERLGYEVGWLDWPGDMRRLLDESWSAAVIALHGGDGENGSVQGVLEVLGVPYSGSGVLASALAMDKVRSKVLASACGVKTAAWHVWTRAEAEAALASGEVAAPMTPPFVVKPAADGSSVGVSVVREAGAFREALGVALEGRGEVLIERFVEGNEVTVGVVEGEALGVCEVVPSEGFYDFAAKYERGDTTYLLPSRLSASMEARLCEAAERLVSVLGCRGVVRVDFLVEGGEEPFFLELNTIPGMTETSLVPKIAASAGLSFDALVERMVRSARCDEERP